MHAGKPVAQVRRDVLTAWAAVPGDDGITPQEAVAGMLGLAWRRAALLASLLAEQAAVDGGSGNAPGGLVGHAYSASVAAGGIYPTAERVRALAELERVERELVVKTAEAAHRMGIEETRVRLMAALGDQLHAYTDGLLAHLGLSSRDPHVQAAIVAAAREQAAREGADGT
jgi:hypothetical protein